MLMDSWKGTVEQGCPLCKWWGVAGAFPTHWNSHNIIDRAIYNLCRWWRK